MKHLDKNFKKHCDQCGNVFFRDKRCTWAHWEKARFCSRICSSSNWSEIASKKRLPLEDIFWLKVEKSDPENCWPWTGSIDRDGYGVLTYKKKNYRAPRLALALSGIDIPNGHYACHSCGNPTCCNPSHIYAGTPVQNNMDKHKHGTHLEGESCHTAKLTEKQVVEIRDDLRSNSEIARQYGVTPRNIVIIKKRKTWKHI